MATGTANFSSDIFKFSVSYEYTNTSFKLTGVTVTGTSKSQYWVDWGDTPTLYIYALKGSNPVPKSYQSGSDNLDATEAKDYITKNNGVYQKVFNGNNARSYLPDTDGGTKTWKNTDFDDIKLTLSGSSATITVGAYIANTTGTLNDAVYSSKTITLSLYTAPSTPEVTVTAVTTTSITVKHEWTNGSVDGSNYETRKITVTSSSNDSPTYSGEASPAYKYSYNNSTYKFSDTDHHKSGSMQPNRKYTITSTIDDGTTNTGHSKTKTIYKRTNVAVPTGLVATSTPTTINVKASSANNGHNLVYDYTINYPDSDNKTPFTRTGNAGSYMDTAFGASIALHPNHQYAIDVVARNSAPDANQTKSESSKKTYNVWTRPAAPNVVSIKAETNSLSIKPESDNNNTGSLSYSCTITLGNATETKTGAHGEWIVFDNLPSNSKYSISITSINTDNSGINYGLVSDEYTTTAWTRPVVSLKLVLYAGSQHDKIIASATPAIFTEYNRFSFSLNNGTFTDYSTNNGMMYSDLNEHTTYTVTVKMKNIESGLESDPVSDEIETWYDPISNLTVVLNEQGYWNLGIKPSFKYSGTIYIHEYKIGSENYQDKETATSYSKDNLKYNTSYTCAIKLTDNHGRVEEATATFKTLDARSLYVDGILRELKIVNPDNSVNFITPDKLSVITKNANGSDNIININDIINPDRLK